MSHSIMPAADATAEPVLLALDLGSTLGWAVRQPRAGITSGTATFRPGRFEGGGMAWLRFRRWLEEMAGMTGPIGSVVFEEVRRHAGTTAAHVYGGFLAHLTAWCEGAGVPYQGVPVGTIKRFATGKGNADKAAVIAAIRARGFAPGDDNEADALAILLWAIDAEGGQRKEPSAAASPRHRAVAESQRRRS
ncbi:hypothetical protein [Roseicella frigidaeris]|uniref:hypothetical protein n=1 Tax=Roseicella frigidaeris TaxID=2230885 RepID=UPI001FB286AE|nr:hypothetical protein [Roseicella frigidaeris]